ncbi:hypothetical protein [Halobacteriovorax sp. CON-3]|uniref:hypothetical protein n=1 Tax=Halobacteriovorax sp. CON-3 TaxID=3157710 RepID=UPI00371101AD
MREIKALLLITVISFFVASCSNSEDKPKENTNQSLVKTQEETELIESWRRVVIDLSDSYYEYYKLISTPIDDSIINIDSDDFHAVESLVILNDLSGDIIYAESELTFYILRSYELLVINIENSDSEGSKVAAQLLEDFNSESGFPDNIEDIKEMVKQRHHEIEQQRTRAIEKNISK